MNGSLAMIGKGATIAFVGSLVALLLGLLIRVLIARLGTEAEYGTYSLAYAILSIAVVIAGLGMQQGVTRSIAHARGSEDTARVRRIIAASIQLGFVSSIALGLAVFLASDVLAARVFDDDALSSYLRVLAFAIPFFTLVHVIVSIFRGFDDMKPTAYFRDIAWRLLFALSLCFIVAFNLAFRNVFYALLGSMAASFVLLAAYAARRLAYPLLPRRLTIDSVGKELLRFSLPLGVVAILQIAVVWTATFMLGALRNSTEVGLYNAAFPVANFISFPLLALLMAYTPVTSRLFARRELSDIRRNFAITTKWLFAATLPLSLILLLYPGVVLNTVFGASYVPAEAALRILALGFIVNNALGPNGGTLVAFGETRFLMRVAFAAIVLNIGLNAALIPSLGIEGAAISSAAAIVAANLLRSWKLYSLSGAVPLTMNLAKPAVLSIGLAFLIDLALGGHVPSNPWMLPLFLVLYYGIHAAAILLTGSFDREDMGLIAAVERRAGVNLSWIKSIARRFL